MTKEQIDAVLDRVRSWPPEDQEQLAEIAREIEAERAGVYVMTDEERSAVAEGRASEVVPDEDVQLFWKRRGLA